MRDYKSCSYTCFADVKDNTNTHAYTTEYTLQQILSEHVDHTFFSNTVDFLHCFQGSIYNIIELRFRILYHRTKVPYIIS